MEGSQEKTRGQTKSREGVVVSDKMDKTVIVAITRLVKNPTYGKYVRKTKKCMAHDEENTCKVGDIVRITETRPMSRHKRWKVIEVITRAE